MWMSLWNDVARGAAATTSTLESVKHNTEVEIRFKDKDLRARKWNIESKSDH